MLQYVPTMCSPPVEAYPPVCPNNVLSPVGGHCSSTSQQCAGLCHTWIPQLHECECSPAQSVPHGNFNSKSWLVNTLNRQLCSSHQLVFRRSSSSRPRACAEDTTVSSMTFIATGALLQSPRHSCAPHIHCQMFWHMPLSYCSPLHTCSVPANKPRYSLK
jgi:hypothetical protein